MDPIEKVRRPQDGDSAGQLVAAALRAELARQNLTAAELADRLDSGATDYDGMTVPMDSRYVRRRLQGQTALTVDDVQWFCAAFDVPMSLVFETLGGDK